MKVRTAVLWWLVNNKEHRSLKKKDRTIEALMPLTETLFPGADYFSITGFSEIMRDCVIPVLKRRYPELMTTPEEKIGPRAMTEVTEALRSKGYEWQDNARWKSKFKKLLAAT